MKIGNLFADLRFKLLIDLPIRKKLIVVLALMLGNISANVLLGVFAMDSLSAIRASVAAEDSWSKSVNSMIFSLEKLDETGDEKYYQAFMQATKISTGDGKANFEINQAIPNEALMEEGFLEAEVDPSDVPGVIRLFVRFRHAPYVVDAVRSWTEGQAHVVKLNTLAAEIWEAKSKGGGALTARVHGPEISNFRETLRLLELDFANKLGVASRWAANLFFWVVIGTSCGLAFISTLIVFYISNNIVAGVQNVTRAAEKASKGDFKVRVENSSQDELGQLSNSFNHMTDALQKLDELRAKTIHNSKLASLGEMAGGIAHEINNPLAIISGNVEVLVKLFESGKLDALQFKKRTEAVSNTIVRIRKIVDGLRSFSRDGSKDDMKVVSVREVIDDALGLCSEKFKGKGVALRAQVPADCGSVKCRKIQLSQVVINLLNNALHAVEHLENPWVEVVVEQSHKTMKISVTDSGLGIAPEISEKMFEPFFTTKDVGEGTGLGLSISSGLVKDQGGTLYLDETSRNTRFIIELLAESSERKVA